VDIRGHCEDRRELHEAQKGRGQFVVASCHASTVLDSVDEALEYVAELILLAIVSADGMSATQWNHGLGAPGANLVKQRVAVVSLFANL
jgi:hypothetical protein